MSVDQSLYQQIILEHNKKPKNFGKLSDATHFAEGFNPLCGDRYNIYLKMGEDGLIQEVFFDGQGCAISKASASMMTQSVKGKTSDEAKEIFHDFHNLVIGKLDPEGEGNRLGKLKIFAGIWKYPARVKCAALAWHTLKGALEREERISTE